MRGPIARWLAIGGLAAAVWGCGRVDAPADRARAGASGSSGGSADDDLAAEDPRHPAQAVFWLELGNASRGACSSAETFELPAGAEATIASGSAEGERILDGDAEQVECRVASPPAGVSGLELELQLSGGEVGQFRATGVVNGLTAPQSLSVELGTADVRLEQADCSARVLAALQGAVWLIFSCNALIDPSSPAITCAGEGGVIFENCDPGE